MNTEAMVKSVKKWLIDNDKTSAELALICELSPQGISNIFAGRARPNKLFLDFFNLNLKITQLGDVKTVHYIKRKNKTLLGA